MTGPDRPVRQPANTRARTADATRPADADDSIVNLQGRFRLLRHDPVGGSSRAGSEYTAAPGNWAPASRPVRAVGGVYTGRRYDVTRKEGTQDGDSRSALTGAGRGWRGVPGAGRVLPAGAAGALLPDARILRRRRGRRPGDDAGRLARHRRVRRGTRLAAHLAVQDRHQPVPQRAPRSEPAPGQGVGYVAVRSARADPARRGRLAAAVSGRVPRGRR